MKMKIDVRILLLSIVPSSIIMAWASSQYGHMVIPFLTDGRTAYVVACAVVGTCLIKYR